MWRSHRQLRTLVSACRYARVQDGFQRGWIASRRSASSSALQQVQVLGPPPSWRKFPENGKAFLEEALVGTKTVTFETGKLAKFAAGAVVVGIKETKVLTTVVADYSNKQSLDFLPLQVEYREKQYAQGKIPNTFMRREGAPKERELLCGRVIDRSIRPLFPKGFYFETQAVQLIEPQLGLAAKVRNRKRDVQLMTIPESVLEKIRRIASDPIQAVMGNPLYGKFERGKALNDVQDEVEEIFKVEGDEDTVRVIGKAFDTVRKEIVRGNVLQKAQRVDGRTLDSVRDLYCEAGLYPALHGSSLFSRGNTQVLCTVTMGAPDDAQRLDSIVGPDSKRFMVHYSFPPFSVNEVGRLGGLNRREVGHGTEKALLSLLPAEDEFPYSIRVTSEVLASDGSSSMATVCGGSLAMMDAGIPLREHVAGVSIGLITVTDPSTGTVTDYKLLTDILGLEDDLGDMDFKIAGTKKGVTAVQLDMKLPGIPLGILVEALNPALAGRIHILNTIEKVIIRPREDLRENIPRRGQMSIHRDSIGRLIGPQGTNIKNIQRLTSAKLNVSDDGVLTIFAKDQASYDQTKALVESCIGREVEVGGSYFATVVAIKDFGAFLELDGGHQGMVHISEISHNKVARIGDVVMLGQVLKVICIGRDIRGNLKLSRKAAISPEEESRTAIQPQISTPDVERKTILVENTQSSLINTSTLEVTRSSSVSQVKESLTQSVAVTTVSSENSEQSHKDASSTSSCKDEKQSRRPGISSSRKAVVARVEESLSTDASDVASSPRNGTKTSRRPGVRAKPRTKGRENVGGFGFGVFKPGQKRANEAAALRSYSSSNKVRQETAEEQSSESYNATHKPKGSEAEGGKAREDPSASSTGAAAAAGAGVFFDKFAKGFSFASASATAGLKKFKDAKLVDAVKGSYNFLKEELNNTSASRRKVKGSGVPLSNVETSDETAIVPVIKKTPAWQKRFDDIMEKARQHPAYKRLRSVKQHPVVAKSQELAEDLRERWETSDSPVVHKIQDLNDSIFGETATAVAMREIRRRDPLFSVPDFILEVQEDIRPILVAYLKGDYITLRKKCSREVVDRCRAERRALESQGIYLDHKILHISDVEVKETKLMGNSPIIIVAFQTQQIYCARDKIGNITQGAKDDIHTVYYAWAMQQLSAEELEEGEVHARWQLREMQQLGIQAII